MKRLFQILMILALAVPAVGLSSCNHFEGMGCPTGDCGDNNNPGNLIEGMVYYANIESKPSGMTQISGVLESGIVATEATTMSQWTNLYDYIDYSSQYIRVGYQLIRIRVRNDGRYEYDFRIISEIAYQRQ